MTTNFIDKIIYGTGLVTITSLTLFWDKRLTWYNKGIENDDIYRKIIFFKYGIIPENVVYQKSKNTNDWKVLSKDDLLKDKNVPIFEINYENLRELSLDININTKNSGNYLNFYKKI